MPVTELSDNIRSVYLVSGCVIERDDKYLLVQEVKPAVRGKWNLPAGKAEADLTLEENAVKEAKEETGFDVKIINKVGAYYREGDKSVRFAYKAQIIGGDVDFDKDEIMDVGWLDYEELSKMNEKGELRNYWVFEAISDSRK